MSIHGAIRQAAPATAGTIGLWRRYCHLRCVVSELELALDVSRVRFPEGYLQRMSPAMASAFDAMDSLERGALANHDEGRMVGHYWLRAPELAPDPQLAAEIRDAVAAVCGFSGDVASGAVKGAGGRFEELVHVGIGGSALGPQLVCEALGGHAGRMSVHFLDNADPDGIDRLLARLDGRLDRTLVSVVSKSGATPTPWYVLAELRAAYAQAGLELKDHAVATSVRDTQLDECARRERWAARFPLWDWVGGRTSVTSAVGLLPLALQGVDVTAFLDGAAAMDRATRKREVAANPAALLALMWHWLGHGRGSRRMVVLPYKDRLSTLPRHVQQLVMESVGKRVDRRGRTVHQGLTVYGNKGSTDQHAYVQQLRDGTPDFFVIFVRAHDDCTRPAVELEPGVTLGDQLFASLSGTREALYERGRDSMTISLQDLGARSVGALVALFERAVGLYAELIDVNAYHQPGVDKYVAADGIELQRQVVAALAAMGSTQTAEDIAEVIDRPEHVDAIFELLEHLARCDGRGVVLASAGSGPAEARFAAAGSSRETVLS